MSTGIQVGHWTGSGTGVSVVLCPPGTVASCEVRGGAPATRETALLEPNRTVELVDAVVLTGGSAFGLAAADGVMAWLAERGRGFPTRGGPIPIVPTAAIYDLMSLQGEDGLDRGAEHRSPGALQGRLAADAAERAAPGVGEECGRVGAGTGATIGKWRGAEHAVRGGLGVARGSSDELSLEAIAVVNSVGDVIDRDGSIVAGSTAPAERGAFPDPATNPFSGLSPGENTTLVVLATDARLTKPECRLMAESGHHGLAQAIRPSHTRHDGDLVICVATGTCPDARAADLGKGPGFDRLRVVATDVVAEAARNAVRQT